MPWPAPAGLAIYAQVDSASTLHSYGAVLEKHEALGQPYNNISGPVASLAGETGILDAATDGQHADGPLPPR
jgi:hypothetical protein